MEHKRELYIDFAKGVAIYLVVLGHIINKVEFSHIYSIIASFHMPMFFFLSGIAMHYTRMENTKYILRKFVNLLIPFVIVGGGTHT
ncbi:MAG: acyltransferase family protein [Treponema sp.]|nr:acyltransferase family protein [Treponema sp.]